MELAIYLQMATSKNQTMAFVWTDHMILSKDIWIYAYEIIVYLEDSKQRNGKCVEVGRWSAIFKVELAAKELHAEKCEDENEQKQEEQQRNDGSHGTEERYHQVAEWWPIFCNLERNNWWVFQHW